MHRLAALILYLCAWGAYCVECGIVVGAGRKLWPTTPPPLQPSTGNPCWPPPPPTHPAFPIPPNGNHVIQPAMASTMAAYTPLALVAATTAMGGSGSGSGLGREVCRLLDPFFFWGVGGRCRSGPTADQGRGRMPVWG